MALKACRSLRQTNYKKCFQPRNSGFRRRKYPKRIIKEVGLEIPRNEKTKAGALIDYLFSQLTSMHLVQDTPLIWTFNQLITYLYSNYKLRLAETSSNYVVLRMKLCKEFDSLLAITAFIQRKVKRSKQIGVWYLLPIQFENYYILYIFQRIWDGQVYLIVIGEKHILTRIEDDFLTPVLPKSGSCKVKLFYFSSAEPLDSQANLFTRLAYLFSEAFDTSGFWVRLDFKSVSGFLQNSAFMDARSLSFIFAKRLKQILKCKRQLN